MAVDDRALATAMPQPSIVALVERQLSTLFAFSPDEEGDPLAQAVGLALNAISTCFVPVKNKYYHRDGVAYFDPFHSGQNSIFLYFLSRHLADMGHVSLADRVYYLNKTLNALDLYHQVAMPPVFLLDHPVGAVIGRAHIESGFTFCQGCTIGNNRGRFPVIEAEVVMLGGAMISGSARIGARSIIGAGAIIVDQTIPPLSVVTGRSPDLRIGRISPEEFDRRSHFDTDWLRRWLASRPDKTA